jgi:hypothetical protein
VKRALLRWLRLHVGSHRHVQACWIVGSALTQHTGFNDVDIVVVCRDWNVRRWLVRVKATFRVAFNMRLDVQLFHMTQAREVRQFLRRAGYAWEV